MRTGDVDDKLETQRQWGRDPCGANSAPGLEPGTPAFFRKVESERYETYAPWMRELMGFENHGEQRVLEIGPGLGTDHAQFARGGARMYALDLTARHLELTGHRFASEGLLTRPVRGDAEKLPFAGGSFDVVYSFGVIHHTPDMPQAVREVHRVLRPGGLALVGLYHRHSAFYWVYTILFRGLVRGGLWRLGRRRLLSEIEYRSAASDAEPLVQVLSREDCRRLFADFATVELHTRHIDYCHLLPGVPPSSGDLRRGLERLARWFGWYLIAFARK